MSDLPQQTVLHHNPLVQFFISTLRIVFALIILMTGFVFAWVLGGIADVKTTFILIFGPLALTGIYCVTRGQRSSVSHKLYGLIFYYLFFAVSYVLQTAVAALFDGKTVEPFIIFFALPFLALPFIEDRALAFIAGNVPLQQTSRRVSYLLTVPLCAALAFLGTYLTGVMQDNMHNPQATSWVAYVIVLILGFIASGVLRYLQTRHFDINRLWKME